MRPAQRYAEERYIVLDGLETDQCWLPDRDLHHSIITRDGVSVFNLPPWSIKQVIYRNSITGETQPSNWYYVDSGYDGHCIRTLTAARKVLHNTMERHRLPPLQPRLKVIVCDCSASVIDYVEIGYIPRENANNLAQLCVDEWEWACGVADLEWDKQVDTIEFHVDGEHDSWQKIGLQISQLTYWLNMNEEIRE